MLTWATTPTACAASCRPVIRSNWLTGSIRHVAGRSLQVERPYRRGRRRRAVRPPILIPTPILGIPMPVTPIFSVNGQLSAENVRVWIPSTTAKMRFFENLPRPLFRTSGLLTGEFNFVVEAGIPKVLTIELFKESLLTRFCSTCITGRWPIRPTPWTSSRRRPHSRESFIDSSGYGRAMAQSRSVVTASGTDQVTYLRRRSRRDHRQQPGSIPPGEEPCRDQNIRILGSSDDEELIVDGRIDEAVSLTRARERSCVLGR